MKEPATLFARSNGHTPTRNIITFGTTPTAPASSTLRVGQDKGRSSAGSSQSIQPGSAEAPPAPQPLRARAAGQIRPTNSKRVQLKVWVTQPVSAELRRVASQNNLSISATGAALLEQALSQNLQTQHAALLEPIIQQILRKEMHRISSRLGVLLVRSLYNSGYTRRLVHSILGRQDGIDEKKLDELTDRATNAARYDVTRQIPQLKAVEEQVIAWFREDEPAR